MEYSNYHKEITNQMNILANLPNTIFLGQQCVSETFYSTLEKVPLERKYEMPVAEELQMGISIGLALEGFLPISIYQRMDFLLRSCDQLVNHLNLCKEMTRNKFNPKIIIRTSIGTKTPLDVGPQHSQDLTEMFKAVLKFPVLKLETVEDVTRGYTLAMEIDSPILLIERQELY